MSNQRDALRQEFPEGWRWIRIARRIGGWLTDKEANGLFHLTLDRAPDVGAVVVELGAWRGKSSVLLAAGMRHKQSPRLFCVDPFGADENPAYQENYYDPLIARMGRSLGDDFRRTIRRCGFSGIVHQVTGYSFDVVRTWREPIDILFIDASHDYEPVRRDVLDWAPFLKAGGTIAMHDVSPNWPGPSRVMAEILQPPYFDEIEQADSLVWAVKKSTEPLPRNLRRVRIVVPKSDFDRRQQEIAQLATDLKYLSGEVKRMSADITANSIAPIDALHIEVIGLPPSDPGTTEETGSLAVHKLQREGALRNVQLQSAKTDLSSALHTLAGNASELRATASELAEARYAVAAMHASLSWRITAPLRFVLDALRLFRGGRVAALQRAKLAGIFQWLRYRGLVRKSGLFDSAWYLKQNPDVARLRIQPLLHYFVFGALEGRSPHCLFDVTYYLASNPDVARSNINPLVHYLRWGAYEGRNPHPEFRSGYYLDQNPDVKAAGLNPLSHYLAPGVAEGRDPNPYFDTSEYMEQHPHVAEQAMNPLVHYLRHK